MTQLGEKEDKLSKGVGFATLQPTFPDASAQLVELMRATLRHAQEITAVVGEAEGAAERAQCKVQTVNSSTTAGERQRVDSEIERLTTWLNRPPPVEEKSWIDKYRNKEREKLEVPQVGQQPISPSTSLTASVSASQEKAYVPSPPPILPTSSGPTLATAVEEGVASTTSGNSQAVANVGNGDNVGSVATTGLSNSALVKAGRTPSKQPSTLPSATTSGKTLTSEMAEEIETTVMWVQQLLESVHFVESNEVMEGGASLLGAVQPGRRHQKEIAITQSVNLLHAKKEEEEDAEDETAVFRSLALQTVAFQRSNLASRE